eukprot:COSAG04_NODE_3225_length_3029_cov_2.159044_2_plen_639_part_00
MAMTAAAAMLGPPPERTHRANSARRTEKILTQRVEARVAEEWGVDMARVVPRVAGEEYGVSSIPTLPPAVRQPADIGLTTRQVVDPSPRRAAQMQPHPPAEPHPSARAAPSQSVEEFIGSVSDKMDVGGLTMDIMMPIYAELEKKALEAEHRADEAAEAAKRLRADFEKQQRRLHAETEKKAEQASLALKGASRELEAKDTVLTDLNERLLQERNEHKGTQRKLDQTRRRLELSKQEIEEKESQVRPLQLQNLEIIQKLSTAEENLAKLEHTHAGVTQAHEALAEEFEAQATALEREKAAREDAQECEAQVRILLEDEADKKGSVRAKLDEANATVRRVQSELEASQRGEAQARSDYNIAMDELDLERTAHHGSKTHLTQTHSNIQALETLHETVRADVAAANGRIDALTQERDVLLTTTHQLREKVGFIIGWLNRGQRVGGQDSSDSLPPMSRYPNATQPTVSRPFCARFPPFFRRSFALSDFLAPRRRERAKNGGKWAKFGGETAEKQRWLSGVGDRNPGDPLPSPKLRVFKHSANLVEVERMGLLKELLSCLELVEPTLASIEQQFEADGAELKELAAQEQLVLEQATVARERAKAMEEQAEAEAEKRRQEGEWIREKAERAQEEMEARMMQQGD